MDIAAREIFRTYGHRVVIGRKTIDKYGRNEQVGSSGDFDITPYSVSPAQNETYLPTNGIDSLSSSESADTNIPIYIEGMTRSGNELTFVAQVVNTHASDGQTRVALTTPLCDCTRVRGVTSGHVYLYENTALTAGKPTDITKIHNQLVDVEGTSLKAGTSVASTNYLIMTKRWASTSKAAGSAAADIRMKVATLGDAVFGDAFFTLSPWSININSPPGGTPLGPFYIVRPNSRIIMTASATTGTLDIEAGFLGVFADIV